MFQDQEVSKETELQQDNLVVQDQEVLKDILDLMEPYEEYKET